MGVLKKSLSHALIFSLTLSSISAFADDSRPKQKGAQKARTPQEKTTPFAAFNTNGFCAKAPSMLEKLNKENEDKLASLESLKGEIDELESYKDVVTGVDAMVQNYQNGLNAIIKAKLPQTQEDLKKDKEKTLDNVKRVVRDGLIINALALMMKDSDLEKGESFKVANLCKKVNEAQPLCSIKPASFLSGVFSGHPLDPVLEGFRKAYANVKGQNKANLKIDVEKILGSIPVSIAPSAILALLNTSAPDLTSVMVPAESKAELLKCLDEKSSPETLLACEKLISTKDSSENFMTKINAQTNIAISKMQPFAKVVDESTRANLDRFNNEVAKFEIQSQTPAMAVASNLAQTLDQSASLERTLATTLQIQQSKANSAARNISDRQEAELKQAEADSLKLPALASLFYSAKPKAVSSLGEIKTQNNREIAAALKSAASWQQKCMDRKKDIDVDFCRDELLKVSKKALERKLEYKSKLEALKTKMGKINTENGNRYKKIETLKKYVAEKYIRTCNPDLKVKKDVIKLDIQIDCESFQSIHTLNTIEGLGNNVNSIMKFGMNISAKPDSTGTFSVAEVQVFSDVCAENDIASVHDDTCDEVKGESIVRAKVKDTKQWEDESEKYYLTYDESSPKGYSRVEKKSNMRVFSEGVIPVVPQMIPMVFGNYMMKQNINMLTNQAMYQKQMLHNIDVYNNNPWMYNYPFFGTTGYTGYGYGVLPGTTTTGAGTGFGF